MRKNLKKLILRSLLGVAIFSLAGSGVWALTLKEKNDIAKTKYQEVKQQYSDEVKSYETAKNQLYNAKGNYALAKNATNTAAYEDKAKAFLGKTIDVLVKQLESLKNWVTNREGIPGSEKQNIISRLDQDIASLNSKKTALPTATAEQIKQQAKDIRTYWKNHLVQLKVIIVQVWSSRISGVINKFESTSLKISQKAAELKTAGQNTAKLESLLADFNQKISLAKQKRDEAKTKYLDISTSSDNEQFFKQAQQLVKDSNNYLKEAHKVLVNIVKELKKLGATLPNSTSTENEANENNSTGTQATGTEETD